MIFQTLFYAFGAVDVKVVQSHYDAPKSIKLNDRRCLQPQLPLQPHHYHCILMPTISSRTGIMQGQQCIAKQRLSAFMNDL